MHLTVNQAPKKRGGSNPSLPTSPYSSMAECGACNSEIEVRFHRGGTNMARIHQLGAMAATTTNLLELAGYLAEAVDLSIREQVVPHTNPVVRLICYMIAFAGDGDIPLDAYYKQVADYCNENAELDQPLGDPPSEPPRKST